MESAVGEVKDLLPDTIPENKRRWYAVKFLENDSKVAEKIKLPASAASAVAELRSGSRKNMTMIWKAS